MRMGINSRLDDFSHSRQESYGVVKKSSMTDMYTVKREIISKEEICKWSHTILERRVGTCEFTALHAMSRCLFPFVAYAQHRL